MFVKTARSLFVVTLSALLIGRAMASGAEDLPDIGSPANAVISIDEEYGIGLGVLREYQNANQIVDDPEIAQYIETVGHRLSSATQDGNHRFHFVVVKDPDINAFAVPGGFIFVFSGLILATHNENELAGVMAHEISHVTQRHIVRSLLEQRRNSLTSTAAMLLAVLLGAAAHGGGDAAMAGIAGAQTLALAQQMSFSRDMEIEADRVGIALLAQAGFDPNGMPNFFETLARLSGGHESQLPAIVLDHPVTTERIAEARARAAKFPARFVPSSTGYLLARERLRVLSTPPGESALKYYQAIINGKDTGTAAEQYGEALALTAKNEASRAMPLLQKLVNDDESVVQYQSALAQAQLQAGEGAAALATFQRALTSFPRDVPTTIHYADALMHLNQPRRAHEVLLDLFNIVEPTPAQTRQIAVAANAAGDVGDAYYYMSEYHIMSGDLGLAAGQLQLALATPKLSTVQRERFRARLDEIRMAMPRRMQHVAQPGGHR